MDFLAIDFETATGLRASACAVGLAVVKDGRVTKTSSELIRSPTLEFDGRNTRIHGITAEMVNDAPTFAQLWPQLKRLISSVPLIAHRASFDMSVIRAAVEEYGLDWPDLRCACTMKMAQKELPGLSNHRLATIANLFGLSFDHHDPASDARACAEIALRLGRLSGKGILPYVKDVPRETGYGPSGGSVGFYLSVEEMYELRGEAPDVEVPVVDAADADGRFEERRFVFTGPMDLDREEAKEMVKAQGAEVASSVSRYVDYLVVGSGLMKAYRASGETTGKLRRALELQEQGYEVQIVEETQFYEMLG